MAFMEAVKEEGLNLSEKIKQLFEVEYLDSMADVQGDVTKLFKEFIRILKRKIEWLEYDGEGEINKSKLNQEINNLAGKELTK